MQFAKRPLLSCTVATTILIGSLVVAPFSLSANGAQVNKPLTRRSATSALRYAHVAFSIRLEDQLLATLRYLPVKFVPASTTKTTVTTTTTTTTAPVTTTSTATSTTTSVPTTTTTKPPKKKPAKKPSRTALLKGSFVWRYPKIVGPLRSLWSVGTNNVVLQGALMNFQAVHGLSWNTGMTAETWQLILEAAAKNRVDPNTYDYVVVAQSPLPEKLSLYVNGHHVYSSFVNTGVSSAPTADGTYPVYERFTVTTMSGTYPDGQTYSDPGIPWVSYFHGGDALHGFLRSQYGFPQSLGCVEMPFANAMHLWPFTPIGTLVSVV
ncbi:MAG: L,D-transpeptidase [Acidimicrobiales bacterium]